MNSILEITENEYLIKLNRRQFNLSFVRSLMQMVEFSDPADKEKKARKNAAANHKHKTNDSASLDDDNEVGMPDRHIAPRQNHNAEPDYFDSLEDK